MQHILSDSVELREHFFLGSYPVKRCPGQYQFLEGGAGIIQLKPTLVNARPGKRIMRLEGAVVNTIFPKHRRVHVVRLPFLRVGAVL
jgi:hypothetical protein